MTSRAVQGRLAAMPDIDRTADIKVTTAAEGTVTAEIPLAGNRS
jgi:hypothetical protein